MSAAAGALASAPSWPDRVAASDGGDPVNLTGATGPIMPACDLSPEKVGREAPLRRGVALRLAEEMVPIGVIARVLQQPADRVLDWIVEAEAAGQLLAERRPVADWPRDQAGRRRHGAAEVWRPPSSLDAAAEAALMRLARRHLAMTASEARLTAHLARVRSATRGGLLQLVSPNAEPKIVDVWICKVRAKLRPIDVTITTEWSVGYAMPRADRDRLLKLLAEREAFEAGLDQPAGGGGS